jgi:hypothetical protein
VELLLTRYAEAAQASRQAADTVGGVAQRIGAPSRALALARSAIPVSLIAASLPGCTIRSGPGQDCAAVVAGGGPGQDCTAVVAGGGPGQDCTAVVAGGGPGQDCTAVVAGGGPGQGYMDWT